MGLKRFTKIQVSALRSDPANIDNCKHKIVRISGVWMCAKCNQHYTPAEIAVLATLGANSVRMCKMCEEADKEVPGR